MDKYIYDDKNNLWYELQGDYYIPCLTNRKRTAYPFRETAALKIFGAVP